MPHLLKPVKKLRNEGVVFTGIIPGMVRRDAFREVESAGGDPQTGVNDWTTILVRGHSHHWRYRDYGLKEEAVAENIKNGFATAVIDADGFLNLIRHGSPAHQVKTIAGIPMSELISIYDETTYSNNLTIPTGTLDRWTEVKSRREQAMLRAIHLRGETEGKCCICGKKYPASLLRTSHLKRRAECSNKEKRDQENIVMLMCETGCDAMYERGYFTINEEGIVVIAQYGLTTIDLRRKLKELKGRKCRSYSKKKEPYFEWHRNTVFVG